MRTLNATLQTAMDSGDFEPIVRAAVLDPDDFSVIQYLDVIYFKMRGIELEIEYYDPTNSFTDTVSLERGALINGVEYTIFSGIYHLTRSYQVTRGRYICEGSLVDPAAINVPADVTYETLIRSVIDLDDMVSSFKTPAAAWLSYQFFPDGLRYATGHNFVFFALLKQKYLIHCCDNGINSILFFSAADVLALASQYTITLNAADTWSIQTLYRQFAWKDETKTLHNPGPATYPMHNLGYLESTANPPNIPSNVLQCGEVLATVIPNLKYQTGDCIKFDPVISGYTPVKSILDVTEVFDARGKNKNKPAWYMELRALPYFTNTSGGFVPTSVQYTSAFIDLSTSGFANNLNAGVTNVQQLADAVDDITNINTQAAVPTVAIAGKEFVWCTGDSNLYAWDGSAWHMVGPPAGTYVRIVGDTMTGRLDVKVSATNVTPFRTVSPWNTTVNLMEWSLDYGGGAIWPAAYITKDGAGSFNSDSGNGIAALAGGATNKSIRNQVALQGVLTHNSAYDNIYTLSASGAAVEAFVYANVGSGHTVAELQGFRIFLVKSLDGTLTTGKALSIEAPANYGGTTANWYGLYIGDIAGATTLNQAIYTNKGLIRFGDQTEITGWQDVRQFSVTGHTTQATTTTLAQFTRNDAAAGVSAMLGLCALGSGTAGDGGSLDLAGKSSTTAAQSMARLSWLWAESTHASRKARSIWSVWDTSEREGIRIEASGSAAMLGFLGATAVVKQTGPTSQEEGYVAGTLDTEAEIISAFNSTNQAVNVIRTALINYGLVTDE
jgi:hypothetical protein